MINFEFDFSSYVERIGLKDVSLDEIIEIVKSLPVDEIIGNNQSSEFSVDAKTYLYSGSFNINENPISARLIANTFDNARTIDKIVAANFLGTDIFKEVIQTSIRNDILRGKFDIVRVGKGIRSTADWDKLTSLLSKSRLTEIELKKAVEIAATAFEFEPTQGAWAIISKNFIEATQPTSRIECIVSDTVNMERTWAAVEIPTALDKLPNSQQIGDYTVGELKAIRDVNGLGRVQELLKDQSLDFMSSIMADNVILHYNPEGAVIGIDLPNNSSEITSDNDFLALDSSRDGKIGKGWNNQKDEKNESADTEQNKADRRGSMSDYKKRIEEERKKGKGDMKDMQEKHKGDKER